jgi:hypothetical protein
MAELQNSPAAEGPQVLYLNGAASPDMPFDKNTISTQKASYSAFEIRVDRNNPNRAELVPVPGADERLIPNYSAILNPAFSAPVPKAGDKFIHVQQPAQLEKVGDTWRITERGQLNYAATPQVQQTQAAAQVQTPAPAQEPTPTPRPTQEAASESAPQQQIGNKGSLNRIQVAWRQVNNEGAPLEGIADYLSKKGLQLDNEIVVKPNDEGKLTSRLNFSFDPNKVDNTTVHGIVSGLNETGRGHGLRVFENDEQQVKRSNEIQVAGTNKEATIARHALLEEIGEHTSTKAWPQHSTQLEKFIAPGSKQSSQQQPGPLVEDKLTEAPAQAQASPAAVPTGKEQSPTEPKSAASLGMDSNSSTTAAPAAAVTTTPTAAEEAKSGVGEFRIMWKQKGDEVAPLMEMRAYLDSLKEQGVAVGAMKFGAGSDGKLTGSFGVSYDPNAPDLTKLEGTIQGLKKVGGGLDVVEAPEQAVARRRGLGHEGQDKALEIAFPIKEAFGVRQWDSLSAQLSSVPKHALTAPEQAQQAAGITRIEEIAKKEGKTTKQIVQDGKNLLDIDTTGNPISAFLKNFYEHLNGGPKTRQNLEVDYEKTRKALQDGLIAKAGNALTDGGTAEAVKAPGVAAVAGATVAGAAVAAVSNASTAPEQVTAQPGTTQAAATPAPAKPEPLFKETELPKDKLALFGLNIATLRDSGQLEKLMNGEKTDLLAMSGGAQRDKPLVPFEGKLQLHREANGSVTLNVELPKQRLVIPNEIGGQPFTPEQKHNLETTGSAGLIRGLRDAAGNPYNGYVGVDPKMNTIVILPENKVTIKDEIAGVKLSPEQSHDLREGHLVHLPNMKQPNGGQSFDGTVQIHAAKAGVEVRPEPYEQQQKKQPDLTQAQPVATERTEKPGQKQTPETAQVQRQEVAPKVVETPKEEPVQQRRSGPRR